MPPLGADPVHKGTLVCVVLKAKNLPNKRSIGKQDPYCVLSMGAEQQKTKPDKRGGQHPTWDEQLHFEIFEDMEDALAKPPDGSVSKATGSSAKTKGGKKVLKVSCYADDTKDPEFIGEGLVDLTNTLKTGEFDEWVTIKAKDRYAGEVYLELTFYSAAAPPKRKKAITPVVSGNDTYGGAGTFQDIDDLGEPPTAPPKTGSPAEIPAWMRPGGSTLGVNEFGSDVGAGTGSGTGGHRHHLSSSTSMSNLSNRRTSTNISHSATLSEIPSSLRPSSSLAQIDAYTPPYAPSSIGRGPSPAPPPMLSHLGDVSGEFGQQPRRDSFVSAESHIIPSSSYYGHSTVPSQATVLPIQHPSAGPDRYGTVSSISSASSHPHLPSSSTMSRLSSYTARPDPTEQLTHSMSSMSFHSGAYEKPLPPPTPTPPSGATPSQSDIYQHPPQISSIYQPQPPAPHLQTYTPQPGHTQLGPAPPPPHSASAPPTHADYGQPPSHYGQGREDVQRPVSPAARPPSSLSTYSTSVSAPMASTPSVINAQAYYQSGSALQPGSHTPQRSQSPGLPPSASMSMPIAAPYQNGLASNQFGQMPPNPEKGVPPRRAPRPLPSTQPMIQQQTGASAGVGPYAGQAQQVTYTPSQYPSQNAAHPPAPSGWQTKPPPPPPPPASSTQPHQPASGWPGGTTMSHSYSQTWSSSPHPPSVANSNVTSSSSVSGYLPQPPPSSIQPSPSLHYNTMGHHHGVPAPLPGAQQWSQQQQQGGGYASYEQGPAASSRYAHPVPLPSHPQGVQHSASYSSHQYGQYPPQ